jgi:uncharacterized protein (TIGR00730 family)
VLARDEPDVRISLVREHPNMRRICVFAGSSIGARPEYAEAARTLGRELAGRGLGVVYGGASVGLMGELADAALAAGGEVIGVLPRNLFVKEVAHTGLTQMHSVGSMHERKALMSDLSDGFIALPGGFGTFDELFEIITWAQIGIHAKPIGLLDVCGYYAPLLTLIKHASREGFIGAAQARLPLRATTPRVLVKSLLAYQPRVPVAPLAVPPPEP